MPELETAVAPLDAKPLNPFSAAFEKAIAEPSGDTPPPEAKPTKPPEQKAPEVKDKKDATPRELFNKPKDGETKPDAAAPESKSAVDEIAPPDFKGDTKARAGWDGLKGKAKEFETLAKTHEARVKELEAKLLESEPLKAQLAERDTKLKEYDEIVARARIDEHPDFRREFIDGRAKLISRAQGIIEESGGDAKQIETALNLKGKARVDALREVAGELDNFQSGRLGRVIDELTDLDDRAQAKRDTAKKSYEELQEQSKQRDLETSATRTRNRQIEFDNTASKLRGSLEVLTKVDGHDAWNTRADTIVTGALDFIKAHPEADIEAEILARSIPAYRDLFLQSDQRAEGLQKRVEEMEAELKAIHGKSPSLSGNRRAGSPASGGNPGKPFSEKMNALMNGGE